MDIPDLYVTPDRYATIRYAGASGDYNAIHIDGEFARAVGLPGQILHGLYTMAQVARAQTDAAGGPQALKSLRVQFRGVGRPEQEISIRSRARELHDGVFHVDCVGEQGGRVIIRNAAAELVPGG